MNGVLEKASERQPHKNLSVHMGIYANTSVGGHTETTKMAKIIELLSDGKWHTLEEIQETTQLTKRSIVSAIQFLKEYGFVIVDKEGHKIRLNDDVRKFLTQTITS
ncbi:MAG: HTH domain-containing protein [Candidatus Bathyarchaeia archaeon]